ncbi:hypothetical protein D3Z52_17900 [Clostridiaceae bacterium]|nr:hypothetical protein [Clostridiaceae bacterium]
MLTRVRLRSGRQGTLSPGPLALPLPCTRDFFVKKSSKNFISPAGGTKETKFSALGWQSE